MGSEDLFHKRKARASTELQRQKRERAQNKRYLIVCEGTKTEPHYLSELLDDLRIRSHMVRIARNDGASPDRVVDMRFPYMWKMRRRATPMTRCTVCSTEIGTPPSMRLSSAPRI